MILRVRYYWDSDSCPRSPRWQVSPLATCHFPIVPSSITLYATTSLYPPPQRAALLPGFATRTRARRHTPPKQVRYPTDRQFASGYSPPRLATTQLPSATELWPTPTGTCTLQMARPHGRTSSCVSRNWQVDLMVSKLNFLQPGLMKTPPVQAPS